MHERIRAGSLEELRRAGHLVVRHDTTEICVIAADGEVYALEDACPHMGSELHRGDVVDGLLVCPWHRARFELATGHCLDAYASDVATFSVDVSDGVVFVDPVPRDATARRPE